MEQKKRHIVDLALEFSVPLIGGVLAAIVWANLAPGSYHAVTHTHLLGSWFPFGAGHPVNLHFVMNDLFMVLFFGIAAKEITEACLPGGPLNPPSKAVNPLLGTLGGVLGPVAAFFAYVAVTGDQSISRGWAIPTATDIALAWLVARLVFGAGHPAISFLLLLAVADDGIGLGIIAVFYGDPENPARPIFLLLVVAAMVGAYLMRKKKVKSFWPYLLGPGLMSWAGLFLAHLHPALAAVFIVPFLPSADHDEGMFREDLDAHDTLNEFEHFFKKPVDIGLFGFGLANAGVAFSDVGNATWAVLFALIVGKSVGIFGFSYLGDKLGFKLPDGMNYRTLFLSGMVAALGLTVALFVAGVAYTDPQIMGAAKMGALMSVIAAPIAYVAAKLMGVPGRSAQGQTSSVKDSKAA